jgi:hypothetical protein
MDPATFTPDDSPLTIDDIMTSLLYQDLLSPTPSEGDVAFDFVLPRLDAGGDAVRLSDLAGQRPVALIFGS